MADVKTLDGYSIKDATARTQISDLATEFHKNNGGTEVTIAGPGVSFPSRGYTFNSDGYLIIHVSAPAPAKITSTVVGSNGSAIFTEVTPNTAGITHSIFVKKGMKLSSASCDGGSWTGGNYIHFKPLT